MNRTNCNEKSSLVGNAAPMSANSRYAKVSCQSQCRPRAAGRARALPLGVHGSKPGLGLTVRHHFSDPSIVAGESFQYRDSDPGPARQ